MARVAVLMSLYNETEEQIFESVNSILEQTFSDFEFVIVNDAPKDKEMLKIAKKLGKLDRRIKVLYNEKNIGLAMSMNKAAEASESEYIARMDADDIAMKKRFEMEVDALDAGYDFVCTNYYYINTDGTDSDKKSEYFSGKTIKMALPYGNVIHHPTVMMRRDFFEKVGGYRDFPCSQDYDLWLRLLEQNVKICSLEEKLLKYRLRDNGVSRAKPMKQVATIDYIRKLYNERIRSGGKDSYSYDNYLQYLKEVGVGDSEVEACYNRYKKIQEKAILDYKSGRKISGMIGYLKAFFGSKFIREKFWNGLKFRKVLKEAK